MKITNSARMRRKITNWLIHLLLAVLSFIWILPIVWIVLTSFRGEPGSYVNSFFPKTYTLANYTKLFTDHSVLNFPKMFTNTLIIAIFTCIVSTFFVLSVSYSLSRLRFNFRKPYMNLAMILGLFPGFMAMIAQYYILKTLGLTEGQMVRIALIMVYSAGAGLGFQIAKGYFDTVPRSIDEAATIDGANQWQIFTKITIPLSKPIIIYTVLTSFMGPWVDFIFAKVLIRANSDQFTVAIGLWNMLQKEYIHQWYTAFAAGAVVVSLPIAALFIYMQKFYVEGVSGAVKG
ncbi:sugar ABC transporter permease [Tuanshanicoccus lijuaniae]|uniref:sugar ABC transporter permease n=1 Tax=Aerococcaceae bacterium zg-1292 TaxID=2774330 RepID=UPI0019357AD4|nr:sugar ABC transporter permease [Aerococcaceae bacterium zg-1292]MBF6625504.1 sugar ABC transporter permease [Aerococcaceae bacterium zg-BR9]MBS4456614.1 sugar ABC transporter permease [Aerococcaceae bacterium zg-A91]MBS4458406.1 sugar ABC transporter permease [Aerococcaceae bacterium zg-BR33]QQA36432.1 sugar ABC transporter permease [Aerococcaceae bacterium zg-1292]